MNTENCKRGPLTLKQKIEILECLKKKQTRKEISRKYNCDISTVSKISKSENEIRKKASDCGNYFHRKRFRSGAHKEIDNAMLIWVREMRTKNANINGPMIKEQAIKFAELLKVDNFKPSNGWLSRWKNRHNITFQRPQGERVNADNYIANQLMAHTLPDLIKNYSSMNVYNADESGLFYRSLPSSIVALKAESTFDEKMQKDQITLLFLVNMDGSDKQVFPIGHEKPPNSFEGHHILPMKYYYHKKSWMTREIWTEILNDWNTILQKEERKILLFVDNAACHKLLDEIDLSNITLYFLPTNTTYFIQPLDQGIIRSFKKHYRQTILQRQLLAIQNGQTLSEFANSITILETLNNINHSWRLVSPTTIHNCFIKSGFCSSIIKCENEDETGFQLPLSVEEFEKYVDCDLNIQCYAGLSTKAILEEIQKPSIKVEQDDIEISNEVLQPVYIRSSPSRRDAIDAICTLRRFLVARHEETDILNKIEEQVMNIRHVQKKISDYYIKKK